MNSMTVVGGSECAFIAALADWLFGLSTIVREERNSLIFKNTSTEETAQLRVQYMGSQNHLSTMEVTQSIYLIEEFDELLHQESISPALRARVPWENCLSYVFEGSSLSQLLANPTLLGTYLGGIARINAALARGERNVLGLNRRTYTRFHPATYGRGLVHTVMQLFPELARMDGLKDAMNSELAIRSISTVLEDIDNTIKRWLDMCTCGQCDSDPAHSEQADGFCMTLIACTVIKLASHLGCSSRDPDLRPTVTGLEKSYRNASLKSTGFQTILEPDLVGNFLGYSLEHPIELLYEIFAGPSENCIAEDCSAIASGGICLFLNALCSPTCQAENMDIVHIRPGYIQWSKRRYETVMDSSYHIRLADDDIATLEKITTVDIKQDSPRTIALSAIVTERTTEQGLYFHYRVAITQDVFADLRPRNLTNLVLQSTGVINCSHQGCAEALRIPCIGVHNGVQIRPEDVKKLQLHESIAECYIFALSTDLGRCVALSFHGDIGTIEYKSESFNVYLRRDECLPCSVQSTLDEPAVWRNDFFSPEDSVVQRYRSREKHRAYII